MIKRFIFITGLFFSLIAAAKEKKTGCHNRQFGDSSFTEKAAYTSKAIAQQAVDQYAPVEARLNEKWMKALRNVRRTKQQLKEARNRLERKNSENALKINAEHLKNTLEKSTLKFEKSLALHKQALEDLNLARNKWWSATAKLALALKAVSCFKMEEMKEI